MIVPIPNVVIVDPLVNSSEPQPTDPTKHTSKSAIDKKAGWLFNAVIETCKEYQNCKSVWSHITENMCDWSCKRQNFIVRLCNFKVKCVEINPATTRYIFIFNLHALQTTPFEFRNRQWTLRAIYEI